MKNPDNLEDKTGRTVCNICANRLRVELGQMKYCEDCTTGCNIEDLIDFFHQTSEVLNVQN